MRSWCFLLISAAAAAAHAAPPQRVDMLFHVFRNGGSPIAEVAHHLQHDSQSYQLSETWTGRGFYKLRGTVRRTSRGIVSAEGLQPVEFVDQRTGRTTARAVFDWRSKTITQQYKGEPRVEPLPADGSDRLAFLFSPAFAPPSGRLSFHLMDGRGVSRHVYSVEGGGPLDTPAGRFETVKLVRAAGEDRTEIWLAPDRSYLPVRILIVNGDGSRYDQVVARISYP